MPVHAMIEERLSAVEAAVAEIQRRLPPPPSPDWLNQVIGSQKDEPAFEDVLALGREYRLADLPAEGGDE